MLGWFRKQAGRDGADDAPPRFVDVPGQTREPSASLLRRLRELDPYADVVYTGEGRWLLGRVRPVDMSRGSSCRMGRRWAASIRYGDGYFAAHEVQDLDADRRERFHALQHALLRAQGFEILKEVVIRGAEVDAILEHELRRILYFETRGLGRTTEEDAAYEAEREAQRRQRRQWERDQVKEMWSRSQLGRGNPAPVFMPQRRALASAGAAT